MLVSLTLKLIAVPELAWPRLTAACDRREPLPSPIGHAGAVAGVAILATFLGAILPAASTVSTVTVVALSAVAGYVGAAALSALVAPRFITTSEPLQHLVPRYAAAASIPVIACGVLNLIALPGLPLVSAAVGTGLGYRAASLGARDFLGLEGGRRRNAAMAAAGFASAPVVLAALFRIIQ